MLTLDAGEPLAVAITDAIQSGDLAELERLLDETAALASARIIRRSCCGEQARSLLHIATDYPGHFPNAKDTVFVLTAAGADVNARFAGPHGETPLHWAASSDDVEVLDALLDAGADLEADGSVIDGGTPLADAVAFGQWNAARRLLERGATANLWQAAAPGEMTRVQELVAAPAPPSAEENTNAFWCARWPARRGRVPPRPRRRHQLDRPRQPHAARCCGSQRRPPPCRLAPSPRRQDGHAAAMKPMDKSATTGVP